MAPKLDPFRFVRTVLNSFMAESGLEPRIFGAKSLRITHANEGVVKFELNINQHHLNRLKILHGGTIAALVDLGGSLAVASKGHYSTGVSTDLNVTYLKSGGKKWSKLRATAVCQRIGKTLAYTSVTFWDEKRQMVARGSHTKFVALAVAGSEPYTVPEGAEKYIAEETDAPMERVAVPKGGEQAAAMETAATEEPSTEEPSEEPSTVPGGGEASTVPEGADQQVAEEAPAPKP